MQCRTRSSIRRVQARLLPQAARHHRLYRSSEKRCAKTSSPPIWMFPTRARIPRMPQLFVSAPQYGVWAIHPNAAHARPPTPATRISSTPAMSWLSCSETLTLHACGRSTHPSSPSNRTVTVNRLDPSSKIREITSACRKSGANGTGHISPTYCRTASRFMIAPAACRDTPTIRASKNRHGYRSSDTVSIFTAPSKTLSKGSPVWIPAFSLPPSHTTRTTGAPSPARVTKATDSANASPARRPIPRNPLNLCPRFSLLAIGTSALFASANVRPGPLSRMVTLASSGARVIVTKPSSPIPALSIASTAFCTYSR